MLLWVTCYKAFKKKVLDKFCYICYSMKYEHFDRKDLFYV